MCIRDRGKGGKFKAPIQPPVHEEPKVEVVKTIVLPEILTIKELAEKMKLCLLYTSRCV